MGVGKEAATNLALLTTSWPPTPSNMALCSPPRARYPRPPHSRSNGSLKRHPRANSNLYVDD